ncbi:MAG: hypothetical protein Q9219_002488 [cf. Caloplaca sp. 3 TL-2023]
MQGTVGYFAHPTLRGLECEHVTDRGKGQWRRPSIRRLKLDSVVSDEMEVLREKMEGIKKFHCLHWIEDEEKAEELMTTERSRLRLHPAVYIASWMVLSSAVILFNKWILVRAQYPVLLTCYHLTFATVLTQILARTSSFLDSRHSVRMTAGLYAQAIVPIGILYSLSLVCSNLPYLYLSVAFIQMLKGLGPIAVFLALCSLRLATPTLRITCNLLVIILGIILASLGEIKFHIMGFMFQMGGIVTEAYRLAFIQKLLSDENYKMDPLVSLYYFAPCCAVMIALMGMLSEWRSMKWEEIAGIDWWIWAANGGVAMGLNVASVLLIGKTSSLVLTLCGVLKNISLIGASMIVWGAVVTPVQFVGNGLAMAGLVYYNLGGEKRRSRGGKVILALGMFVGCVGMLSAAAVGCGLDRDLRGYWSDGEIALVPSSNVTIG